MSNLWNLINTGRVLQNSKIIDVMVFSQNFIYDQIIFLELCSRFSGVLHSTDNRSVKIRIRLKLLEVHQGHFGIGQKIKLQMLFHYFQTHWKATYSFTNVISLFLNLLEKLKYKSNITFFKTFSKQEAQVTPWRQPPYRFRSHFEIQTLYASDITRIP